jgi:protein SCO1/2
MRLRVMPVALAALLLAGLGTPVQRFTTGASAFEAVVDAAPLPGRFPNVRLRTQHGQEVRFYDDLIKGKIVLINFMFTSCTAQCPRSTANLAKVQQAFGEHAGRDVFLISISVDPEHDTPAALKKYADRFQARPGWVFVTGAADDINLIRRTLGVYDGDDKAQHTGMVIYGNDATGSWAGMPVTASPSIMVSSVLRLLEGRGTRSPG